MELLQALPDLLSGAAYIVSGASVIASIFPAAQKVGVVLGTASKVINFLACNFGNAKNKD